MTRPIPSRRSTRKQRNQQRRDYKAIKVAHLAEQRPINRLKAAQHRARQKLKRAEAGEPVRPLTPLELRALGRGEDEIAEAEARIVRERERREDQQRAEAAAKRQAAIDAAAEQHMTQAFFPAPPKPDADQRELDRIERAAARAAQRPPKPTPPPPPEPPPSSLYWLTPEQHRSLSAARRLRTLLNEARNTDAPDR